MTLRRIAVCVVLLLGGLAPAQDQSKYPRVNLAVSYEVDVHWPRRPAHLKWGAVSGVAVDAKDSVYVFTRADEPVQVYAADGKFVRSWGKDIKESHHIRIDRDGNVWVADIGYHVVQKYTPDGKLLLTLGTKGTAGRDRTHLNMPTDVAVAANGDVYVSDGYGNARVVVFDQAGQYLREWGELGHGPGQFSIPHAVVLDSKGRVFVADRNNVRVQVFDGRGKFLEEWRDVVVPWGLHMTKDDQLWVCGSSPMQWRKEDKSLGVPPKDQVFVRFDAATGRLRQLFTVPKGLDGAERPGDVNWVHCIALDSRGNVYLGDIKGQRAQKFVLRAADR